MSIIDEGTFNICHTGGCGISSNADRADSSVIRLRRAMIWAARRAVNAG
jgi:hypothetical protein